MEYQDEIGHGLKTFTLSDLSKGISYLPKKLAMRSSRMRYKGSGLLPYTYRSWKADSYASSKSTHRGEMLQMRLLQMDERSRSHVLYEQISSFEDKVYKSFGQFDVELFYRMLVALSKHTIADIHKLKTISAVRQCHNHLKELKRCKVRFRHGTVTAEEEKLISYFSWFLNYYNYIRHLRDNFIERIYKPLFQYFYPVDYDRPDRETSSISAMSMTSLASMKSMDSGYSGLSGLTTLIGDADNWSMSFTPRSGNHDTHDARRRLVMKQALVALGREFEDIRKLYDTTEIEKLAQRLSHLKERTDHLLDLESRLDAELFGQDSEKPIFGLKISDKDNEKLVRLIPDILMKFQKESWLAKRWLEKDDEKTLNLNAKLEKLTKLEEDLNKRLYSLSKEIQYKELELESNAELLNKLLNREDRAINLGQNVYEMRRNRDKLTERLEVLNSERSHYCEKLYEANAKGDIKTCRRLKPLYEKNKIQRFAIERQIATLNYHIDLTESDMNIEIDVKAEVIHTTNDVQDKCEEIEGRLEKAKKEQKAIQAALIPIVEDRKHVKERLQLERGMPVGEDRPSQRAKFIRSFSERHANLLEFKYIEDSPFSDHRLSDTKHAPFFVTELSASDGAPGAKSKLIRRSLPDKLNAFERVEHTDSFAKLSKIPVSIKGNNHEMYENNDSTEKLSRTPRANQYVDQEAIGSIDSIIKLSRLPVPIKSSDVWSKHDVSMPFSNVDERRDEDILPPVNDQHTECIPEVMPSEW